MAAFLKNKTFTAISLIEAVFKPNSSLCSSTKLFNKNVIIRFVITSPKNVASVMLSKNVDFVSDL